jgi:hypothetical protein
VLTSPWWNTLKSFARPRLYVPGNGLRFTLACTLQLPPWLVGNATEDLLNLANAISVFETSAPQVVSENRETPVH